MAVTAQVIADNISVQGTRITTLQLRYPKFIHGEFLTHRQFSRNSSSSRAIPIKRMIKDVLDDPVLPIHWGKNQPGMSADEECRALVSLYDLNPVDRATAWTLARDKAIDAAIAFEVAGYHKQIINRLLEPFMHINTVVTATEWSNFFALRLHHDAQPEMRRLAEVMFNAMAASSPTEPLRPGEWHVPYFNIRGVCREQGTVTLARQLSAARCARVSYLTTDGRTPDIEEDLKLCGRLSAAIPIHASPFEHQATPDITPGWTHQEQWGNFKRWIQYRKLLPGECQ